MESCLLLDVKNHENLYKKIHPLFYFNLLERCLLQFKKCGCYCNRKGVKTGLFHSS